MKTVRDGANITDPVELVLKFHVPSDKYGRLLLVPLATLIQKILARKFEFRCTGT